MTQADAINTETEPRESEPQESLVEQVADFFEQALPKVPGFQKRQSQFDMALAVAEHIDGSGRLAVEAGTGTGKSLAYLVPLLLRESTDDCPAIIATKTVQLQYQLLKKDLPELQGLLASPKKVVQAKGWSNYLCLRKIESPDEPTIRSLGPSLTELRKLSLNRNGIVTRQEAVLRRDQWERVKADPLDCQKRHCPHFSQCGLFAERRELESAEVIITNHAFLLTDLRFRREGRGLLPEGDILIVDEAHRLDDVATEHLAIRFDPDRIFSCISSPLLNAADGWLAATRFTFLMTLPELDFQPWSARFDQVVLMGLKDLENLAADLFLELQGLFFQESQGKAEIKRFLLSDAGFRLANLAAEMCLALEEIPNAMLSLCREYEESFHQTPPSELMRLAQSLERLGRDLHFLVRCDSEDWVYLVESEAQALVARPVDNAEALEKELFDEYQSVILTSASLKVGDSFQFFRKRSGLNEGVNELAFASPFQMEKNTFVGLVNSGPEPGSAEYTRHLCPRLLELMVGLGGRTFLLTTSHRRVKEFRELLREPLALHGISLLTQGEESPAQLLRRFSAPGQHVLIGVDTFWEGVDIPGERLSCVIMTRLPFPVPSDILFQARANKIEAEGGRAFKDLSMPLVGLKMKQGFGRLLRSEGDRGIFLLTDPRAATKRYGRQLIKNLPCEHALRSSLDEVVQQALAWSEDNLA